ncbi:TPM domain-containing protein [Luteolibacter flavescens]|uniref:TPM domain-containing protein n=1 Tax=Luteolibacter flavescens TaxID=1859460 RepID=A0ABT3FV64_9BACT|nr:TPM domain-containing protein [Luteolibacter flavescens]MCW1887488.1 TPM domain-containing protein [Luteolibacter flavescens]
MTGRFVAPPLPADGILDEARMFVRNPEQQKKIATVLAALEEKHGYPFYFVLYDSLFGLSVGERAHALREAWLGDSPGLVLVLETDSRIFRFSQTPYQQDEVPADLKLPLTGPKEIGPTDLAEIGTAIEGSLSRSASTEEYAENLAIGLATGISKVFDARAAVPEGSTKSRVILLAVGFGAAVGLVALLVVAGLKRAEARSLERFVFPKATVGIRLGAPFGGGKVSSRSFGNREEGR